jgi:hypothetical protein
MWAETLKEQIDDRFLRPLLEQQGIQLPRGTQPMDLLDRLIQADPTNLNVLTTIYQSLDNLGVQSPYFQQIIVFVKTIREILKNLYTERGRPVEIHRFLTGTISWQLGQLITMFVPRKIGIFTKTKGFIKLSSQFIFSREQSTFVISYISLLRHLTEFPPHLFAKSRSTVVKSHLVCWTKWQ